MGFYTIMKKLVQPTLPRTRRAQDPCDHPREMWVWLQEAPSTTIAITKRELKSCPLRLPL
jgi:hypothetical protein